MSIQVNDFRWEPGKNDTEYIKLLESSRDEWQKIAQKAIAKLKALSKAQEPEALDAQKQDSDVGCWYDITHNYTLEQVVNALKSRELCEDAVSRKYLLGQSYSIKFQTIDESDEEAYREKVVCVEDIEDAPSVQPISVARVMTLEEVKQWCETHPHKQNPIWVEFKHGYGTNGWRVGLVNSGLLAWCKDNEARCWTSCPSDEVREAVKWE